MPKACRAADLMDFDRIAGDGIALLSGERLCRRGRSAGATAIDKVDVTPDERDDDGYQANSVRFVYLSELTT